jgi:hypothetical protein
VTKHLGVVSTDLHEDTHGLVFDPADPARTQLFVASDGGLFGRGLKTLKGLTPYEFICKRWTIEPKQFRLNPIHQMPGLNTYCNNLFPSRVPSEASEALNLSRACSS